MNGKHVFLAAMAIVGVPASIVLGTIALMGLAKLWRDK